MSRARSMLEEKPRKLDVHLERQDLSFCDISHLINPSITRMLSTTNAPCIAIELATFVDAKDKINILASTESLVQNTLVVTLRCPKASLDTEIQIELGR